MNKTYRYSVYELVMKYIGENGVEREEFHFSSKESAKKFSKDYCEKDKSAITQRIKEIKVYDFVSKGE